MKEMWDIFPGWNVSLWNRYLKGTFTGGKQTQLLKDTQSASTAPVDLKNPVENTGCML